LSGVETGEWLLELVETEPADYPAGVVRWTNILPFLHTLILPRTAAAFAGSEEHKYRLFYPYVGLDGLQVSQLDKGGPTGLRATMKWLHRFVSTSVILLSGLGRSVNGADSSTYYFKRFSTSGSIGPWYNNDNFWGVSAPDGTGFVAMAIGEDWGTWSPVHTLPKKINDVNPGHNTWFSQSADPADGQGYDAW
jgi:hypothetical protein